MLLVASLICSLALLANALISSAKNGLSEKAVDQFFRPFHLKQVEIKNDVGFYQFAFGNSVTFAFASFHYYSDNYTQVQIIDGYCPGDSFAAYDNDIPYFSTPNCGPPVPTGTCPNYCTDPETCLTNGINSCRGTGYFAPGYHNITILLLQSPFTGGAAFIRLQTMCFMGGNFAPCCTFTNNCVNGLYETV